MATELDLRNGIDTEALRGTMDAISQEPARGLARFQVATSWQGGTRSESRIRGWELGGQQLAKDFSIAIDEPAELLGTNSAPNPQEYLLAAVNACMMATFVAACSMRNITIHSLQIETSGQLDLRGFLGLDDDVPPGYEQLEYVIRVSGDASPEEFERAHRWVMAKSPNFWNMAKPIQMKPRLVVN